MSYLWNSRRGRGPVWILCLLLLLLWIQSLASAQSQTDDNALIREGEALLSRGETEKALWRFRKLVTEFPQSPQANEAKYRMAVCYTQLKRPKDAIRVLNELFATYLPPARMLQVFTLLGDNTLELKDRFSALQWYGKGILVQGQSHDELKKKVRSIIDTFETEKELIQVESVYRGAYAGGYAKLKLVQLARRQGKDPLVQKLQVELDKEYRGTDYLPKTKETPETVQPAIKAKYTIGVILPLTGAHKLFAERALKGIELTIKEIEAPGKPPLIALAVRDTKGNPLDAERAVEELVNKERVIAIIGPLLSIDVDRAARKAQQLKVPLITLSPKESIPGRGEFVFQNSLTPSDQTQALVGFAIKELRLRTFATFYPNSPYGLYLKNLFGQDVLRGGGKMVGTVAYQEDQNDFSQEIKGFFKVESLPRKDAESKKNEEFKVGLSVDGLFIPDTDDRVAAVISQTAYYDVRGVTFLGTNAWNGPQLISIAGRAAEGATFVDAFSKKDPSPLVARFIDGFRKAYGKEPETLEALSYDTARLLRELLLAKLPSTPVQLRDELQQIQDFHGISGIRGFGEGGKTIRVFSILRVTNGQIEQIPQ